MAVLLSWDNFDYTFRSLRGNFIVKFTVVMDGAQVEIITFVDQKFHRKTYYFYDSLLITLYVLISKQIQAGETTE